jgi:MFS family permease
MSRRRALIMKNAWRSIDLALNNCLYAPIASSLARHADLRKGKHVMSSVFGLGVALGCDYPTAHLIISESIPSAMRGRLVLSAFGFQALGALTGTVVGYLVFKNIPEIGAWRWMYATAIIPALLVTIGRFKITDAYTGCLSGADTKRLRQKWRDFSRASRNIQVT